MGLKPVEKIPAMKRESAGPGKAETLIQEFIDSGLDKAEVTAEDGQTYGKGFASGLNAKSKAEGYEVKAVRRGDAIFLHRHDWTAPEPEAEASE